MEKGGSKVFTAVIAFLLGFIFAILVEIGAVVGVYFYVTKTDLDSIFNTLGIKNKDEDGNYIYVNTDGENGGATNVGELFTQLKGYLYSDGSSAMDYPVLGKTIEEISNLLPVVQKTLSAKLYPMVNKYIDIDWDTFEQKPISEMPQFLSECIMDVRPAKLLETLGMNGLVGEDANAVVKALLAGAEFSYAYTQTGLKFPVYYDTYVFNEQLNAYYREEAVDGQQAFPDNLSEDLLYDTKTKNTYYDENGEKIKEERIYRLYFIPCSYGNGMLEDATLNESGETIYAEGTSFIAVKYVAEGGEYVLDLSNPSQFAYLEAYGSQNMDRTGNFYYTNGDSEIQVYPVTIRSFSDSKEVFKPLYSVSIKELLGGGDNAVIETMFGNLSVGELMDGKIDFDEAVNELELAKVINVDPDQPVMAYIGYGLSNVKAVDGKEWNYEGYANVDGVSTKCYIESEYKGNPPQHAINRVWYNTQDEDGKPIQKELVGTKVKEVASLANDLEVAALMTVKTEDAILSYIGYGVMGVKQADAGQEYSHTGKYKTEEGKEVDCYIASNADGIITSVWYTENGEKVNVGGTTVSKLPDKINGLSNDLTLGDVIDIDENDKTLYALRDSKISEVGNEVKKLKVCDVMEEEDINKSAILRQLKNKTIDDLSTAIDDISIQSIYSKDIYGLENEDEDPTLATEYKENMLYFKKDESGVFSYVNIEYANDSDDSNDDLVGRLTKEQFEAGTYYSYGEAKGMWRLILFKQDKEKVYTLNNFNNMINSSKTNINNATLKTLKEAGIIDENADLGGTLRWTEDGVPKHAKLEDMKLFELINAVIAISKAVPTT